MFKKLSGSVVRTVFAVVAGYAMAGMDIEQLEAILKTVEYWLSVNKEIIGVVTAVTVQGWSIVEKHKSEKQKKELKTNAFKNLNT